MKSISLWEPWASAMAHDLKRFETRGWATRYRGPLAIHAAKRRIREDDDVHDLLAMLGKVNRALSVVGGPFPYGCVVAIVNLDECLRVGTMDVKHALDAGAPGLRTNNSWLRVPAAELPWGNYEPGRFAWTTSQLARLKTPIPVRGAQGLWEWDAPAAFEKS